MDSAKCVFFFLSAVNVQSIHPLSRNPFISSLVFLYKYLPTCVPKIFLGFHASNEKTKLICVREHNSHLTVLYYFIIKVKWRASTVHVTKRASTGHNIFNTSCRTMLQFCIWFKIHAPTAISSDFLCSCQFCTFIIHIL